MKRLVAFLLIGFMFLAMASIVRSNSREIVTPLHEAMSGSQ